MSALLLILIIITCGLFIAIPYLRKDGGSIGPDPRADVAELHTEFDNLLGAIKDIELERETGKVSSEDYAEINARYRERAVGLLRRIEAAGKTAHPKRTSPRQKSLSPRRGGSKRNR